MRFLLPLILTAALAGCDATSFANADQAVVAAHRTSAQTGTLGLSAAAYAAGAAAVHVVEALAPGTLAARRLLAAEPATMEIVDAGAGVDLDLAYFTRHDAATGATQVELVSLTGTSQGFRLDVRGTLAFDPGARAQDVDAELTGSISTATMAFAVDALAFATTWPLPAEAAELGRATFRQLEDGRTAASLDAWLRLDDAGTLTADGTVTKDGVETPMAQLGQARAAD